jgi:hypothetical protein
MAGRVMYSGQSRAGTHDEVMGTRTGELMIFQHCHGFVIFASEVRLGTRHGG